MSAPTFQTWIYQLFSKPETYKHTFDSLFTLNVFLFYLFLFSAVSTIQNFNWTENAF